MDEVFRKKVMIGVAVCCIAIAAVITIKTFFSSDYGDDNGNIQLLCANLKCGYAFELSQKEYADMTKNEDVEVATMQRPAVKCSKCGGKTAYIAMKCEKCGNVFFKKYMDPMNYDKCPKCGFSKSEQLLNEK
jgi:DNA-directed RNA polymerase subunit M/transcription elongation factor TFIIS